VLRDRRQSLIQQILQAEMVRPDYELPQPEVRMPMSDGFDQANQLPLIGSKFGMVCRDGVAEERDGPCALV
jgi:hypothetical protein